MSASAALAQALRAALQDHGNPGQAGTMQAYMKSALPFHGVAAPQRRQLVKTAAALYPVTDADMLRDALLLLWRDATHREQRYAALDLLRLQPAQRLIGLWLLPVLQEFIKTGPWWDHNDELSGESLGLLLQRHPAELKPLLRQWATDPDLWFRRAAMLCQRGLKADSFDAALLYDCILPSMTPSPLAGEFFIRKGMGWALRERSYAAPEEVKAFCAAYHRRLSPLTLREALKVVNKRGL